MPAKSATNLTGVAVLNDTGSRLDNRYLLSGSATTKEHISNRMTTVTLTQARAQLGKLCNRAKPGEEIGIIAGNQVLQLQPVSVRSARPGEITILRLDDDYALREYGLTAQEWRSFQKRERARYARDKRAGQKDPLASAGTFVYPIRAAFDHR